MLFLPPAFPQAVKKIKLHCISFDLEIQSLVTTYCLVPMEAFKKVLQLEKKKSHREQSKAPAVHLLWNCQSPPDDLSAEESKWAKGPLETQETNKNEECSVLFPSLHTAMSIFYS